MTLTDALRASSNSLNTNAGIVSTISKNIAGVASSNYSKRTVEVTTDQLYTTRLIVNREVNYAVFNSSISALSDMSETGVLLAGLNEIATTHGGDGFSGTALVGLENLRRNLEHAAANPSNPAALSLIYETANTFSQTVQSNYQSILSMNAQTDAAIADGVRELNDLLARFGEVNTDSVRATTTGQPNFEAADERDRLIEQISRKIGVSILRRQNNDIMLLASNGAVLFDREPRLVEFTANAKYSPSTTGNPVTIDGIPLDSGVIRSAATGELAGQIAFRDNQLATQRAQLDELARATIEVFAEKDQSGSGKPDLAGLFTWSGGPLLSPSATLTPGIALGFSVNPAVDPTSGGNVTLIRDGAINGDPDYLRNMGGGVGYSDRLFELASGFDKTLSFDGATGLETSMSLVGFASASVDSFQALRARIADKFESEEQLSTTIRQSLKEETGPNLDQEMAALIQVERAYQASAKVMSTVDTLLMRLLEVV